MKVQINGLNLEVTEHLRDLVHKKLARKLDKLVQTFNQDLKLIKVKLEERSDWGYQLKATVDLAGHQFHADARTEKIVKGLVEVREKLEQQIRKFTEELQEY